MQLTVDLDLNNLPLYKKIIVDYEKNKPRHNLLHENSDAFLQYGASLSDDEIEAQIQQRNEARKANDFQKADQILLQLIRTDGRSVRGGLSFFLHRASK
mgnify:CR=1 FL=1